MDPDKEKLEKTNFTIDGKELVKKAKDLNRPAEALAAYLNAGFYDKDLEKMNELTGEDGKQFASMIENSVKTSSLSGSYTYSSIDEQSFTNYFKNLKAALQKNVKFETKVLSVNPGSDTAEVEIKSKPIVLSDLQIKVESERNKIRNENPNISYPELVKRLFDFTSSQLPEAKTSDTEEVVTVNMKKHGENQWRIEEYDIKRLSPILYKN